jgi:hypothetical protein
MDLFIGWFESSPTHTWMVDHNWSTVVLEIIHFFGLCLLLGALLIIDLRMIGWFKSISVKAIHSLLPVVFIGFGLNLVSGVLFVFYDPARYLINISFQIKMVLVFLGGLNALFYYWKIHPNIGQWSQDDSFPAFAKLVAAASLLLWYGVLTCGRFIPYVGTG